MGEKFASPNQGFKNAEINFFAGPLTFTKQCCSFVLLTHNINLCLTSGNRVISPPTAKGCEVYGSVAGKKRFPKILRTDIFKNLFFMAFFTLRCLF